MPERDDAKSLAEKSESKGESSLARTERGGGGRAADSEDTALLIPVEVGEPKSQKTLASLSYYSRSQESSMASECENSGSHFLPSTYRGPQPLLCGPWAGGNSNIADPPDAERPTADEKASTASIHAIDSKSESKLMASKSYGRGSEGSKG
jgi:hypothetical protein